MKYKINYKNLFKSIVIIVLIISTGIFIVQFWHDLKAVRVVNPQYIFPIILAQLLITYSNGRLNNSIWYAQGLRLSFKEWFGLTVVANFINFIVPMRGGLFTQAGYLKSRYNFSISAFVTALSAAYVIIFGVNSLLALLGLTWLWWDKGFFSESLMTFFGSMTAIFAFIMVFSPKFKEVSNKWLNRFIVVLNDWHTISKQRILLVKIAFFAGFNVIVNSIAIFFQFKVLGFEIGIVECLILGIIGGFSLLLSLTPGNVGIREAITAVVAVVLGIAAWQSVLVGLLDRLVGFVFASALSPYFFWDLSLGKKSNQESVEVVA